MSTIGELTDIGVPDLIAIFSRRQRTGRLTIKAGGQEVFIYFDGGRLVMVSSTDLTLRLGRMLVRQGLLDAQRLLEALHAQAESRGAKPIGALIVERGWVTEADLTRCVEDQSVEVMARVINDQTGLFIFDSGVTSPTSIDAIPLEPMELLRAARERVDALKLLRQQLPDPGTQFILSHHAADTMVDDLASPEAMVVHALRTGAKTLPELSLQMALDELTLCVTVIGLRERGIIDTVAERTMR
jgi:hypothetical protein